MTSSQKSLFCFLLLAIFHSLQAFRDAEPGQYTTKWVLTKGGSLEVKGSTNINNFTCGITGYSNPDTLIVTRAPGDRQGVLLKGSLSLDVKLFDCRNPVMTSDLRKTLRSKDHPKLKIRFLSLSRFPDLSAPSDNVKGMVDIELAGVTKRFDVNYRFYRDQQKIIRLIGQRDVNFSDFNLSPPRKLGGMIQTDDKLKVQFQLGMKTL